MQIFDQSFHSIVDAADPNAALIPIQSQHHGFVIVDRSHEVIRVVTQGDNLNFALIDARLVDVLDFVDANFDRAFFDSDGGLKFVVQSQMRVVLK